MSIQMEHIIETKGAKKLKITLKNFYHEKNNTKNIRYKIKQNSQTD